MVVLVMDQYSSVLKSSWHSTHFWSPQEQVKVKIESEDVHIQVLTKSVASSLFRAFAAFFGFKKIAFGGEDLKETHPVHLKLTDEQKAIVSKILGQNDKPISWIKEEVEHILHSKELQEFRVQQVDEPILKEVVAQEKPEIPVKTAVEVKEEPPVTVKQEKDPPNSEASASEPPSRIPSTFFEERLLDSLEGLNDLSEEDVQDHAEIMILHDVQNIKTHLEYIQNGYQLPNTLLPETPKSWIGQAVDGVIDSFVEYYDLKGLARAFRSQKNEDLMDRTLLSKHLKEIESLAIQLIEIERLPRTPKEGPVAEEIKDLKDTFRTGLHRLYFIRDYEKQMSVANDSVEEVNKQISELQIGRFNLSPINYRAILVQIKNFQTLAEMYSKNLMYELNPNVTVEMIELKAHADAAKNGTPILFWENVQAVQLANALYVKMQQLNVFANFLKEVIVKVKLSDSTMKQVQGDLKIMKAHIKQLEGISVTIKESAFALFKRIEVEGLDTVLREFEQDPSASDSEKLARIACLDFLIKVAKSRGDVSGYIIQALDKKYREANLTNEHAGVTERLLVNGPFLTQEKKALHKMQSQLRKESGLRS